jgi:hypothetical protein
MESVPASVKVPLYPFKAPMGLASFLQMVIFEASESLKLDTMTLVLGPLVSEKDIHGQLLHPVFCFTSLIARSCPASASEKPRQSELIGLASCTNRTDMTMMVPLPSAVHHHPIIQPRMN